MVKSQQTKNELINATINLLKVKSDFTIKEIADAAYVNIAAVNYHFGDKNALVNIALDKIIGEVKAKISIATELNYPTIEKAIESFVEIIYSFAAENKGVVRYIMLLNNGENKFIKEFLLDNVFTALIAKRLQEYANIVDERVAYAKYLLIFSSFILPMLYEFNIEFEGLKNEFYLYSVENREFRTIYIDQLVKLITS